MRVAFDAKKAVRNFTGIGNYSRRVITALNAMPQIESIELFAPNNGNTSIINSLPSKAQLITPVDLHCLDMPLFELWRATRSARIANARHIDLYHGLSNELPADISRFRGAKVVTIHDLIFMKLPQTYPTYMRHILEHKTRKACREADIIHAISNRTKLDLIDIYGIEPSRIEVIYQSIDPIYFESQSQTDTAQSNPYIICVGTVEQRKNQRVLIEALTDIDPSLRLVIIGRSTPYQDELTALAASLGVGNRVEILNNVATADLPQWYHNAVVTCNPSHYEGFGLPIAESIAQGTPVIAAKGSCLEEAAGPSGTYIDADDTSGWSRAINAIASDPALRNRLSQAGLQYADNFRDSTMAQRLFNLYSQLC